MSKSKNIFITGGNRGIGFGLVEKILAQYKPENLFATFRDAATSEKLQALAAKNPNLHLVQLDVRANETKLNEIVQLVEKKTKGAGLNLLINNSGIIGQQGGLDVTTKEDMLEVYEVNTVAPLLITKAFLPLLEKASAAAAKSEPGIGRAAIVNISTILASNTVKGGGYYAYRASKAAMNIVNTALSVDYEKSKIIAVVIHPGWVQTDMGTKAAPTTISDSVTGLANVIESLNESKSGKFLDFEGKELPW